MTIVTAAEIERAYQNLQLENDLGWRFLMTPADTLLSASVVILTLNPGGRKFECPSFSVENGNGYFDEEWSGHERGTAPLQKQIQLLLRHLKAEPHETCIGYLVPFRSPSWAKLKKAGEALAFGIQIWQRVLAASAAHTVVLMGCHRFPAVQSAFGLSQPERCLTGWGQVPAKRWRRTGQRQFLGLPHLSRFQVFGRTAPAAGEFYSWIGETAELKSCLSAAGEAV